MSSANDFVGQSSFPLVQGADWSCSRGSVRRPEEPTTGGSPRYEKRRGRTGPAAPVRLTPLVPAPDNRLTQLARPSLPREHFGTFPRTRSETQRRPDAPDRVAGRGRRTPTERLPPTRRGASASQDLPFRGPLEARL